MCTQRERVSQPRSRVAWMSSIGLPVLYWRTPGKCLCSPQMQCRRHQSASQLMLCWDCADSWRVPATRWPDIKSSGQTLLVRAGEGGAQLQAQAELQQSVPAHCGAPRRAHSGRPRRHGARAKQCSSLARALLTNSSAAVHGVGRAGLTSECLSYSGEVKSTGACKTCSV